MHRTLATIAIATAAIVAAQPANADVITLNLTGSVGNFVDSPSQPTSTPGVSIDDHTLQLDGVSPFSVSQGDSINLNVTLDQAYTIPSTNYQTFLLDYFSGSGFDGTPTATTNTLSFFYGSNLVAQYSSNASSSNQISTFAVSGPHGPLTFDSYSDQLVVGLLDAPVTIQSVTFDYRTLLASAVPEPGSWALMIGGIGMTGGALRRRHATRAAVTA